MHRRLRVLTGIVAVCAVLPNGAQPVRAADPVVVGAGDIAGCSTKTDLATADLLDGIAGTVITLGDNVYPSGSKAQFRDCYEPTWGRHLARTRPAPGNHDYETSGAAGYFGYFGSQAGSPPGGYYSYDLGTWHVIVLNSNCAAAGGCGASSAQIGWLRKDLTAHADANVLAYWHHPRFSSGVHGPSTKVDPIWEILYAAGVDVVLNGHDHDYERFAPQDPWGRADPAFGIREFVIGTGGTALRGRGASAPNSQVFSSTHGVIELTLQPTGYDWRFVPIAGSTFTDSGHGTVHPAPPDRTITTFPATTDSYVDQAHPRRTLGGSGRLWSDGRTGRGQERRTYVKVEVSGASGVVDRAILRLWVTNETRDGPRVFPTSTSWSGRTITWRNQPGATGPAAFDAGRLMAGQWAEFDVTSLIDGDGTYGFLLRSSSGDGVGMSSLQGGHPPRLRLETIPATP